jgi:hypothetical protein
MAPYCLHGWCWAPADALLASPADCVLVLFCIEVLLGACAATGRLCWALGYDRTTKEGRAVAASKTFARKKNNAKKD